jgi:TolB-like protein
MTTSRSIALASNRAARLLAVFAAACVYLFGVDASLPSAEAQKRVVVLSFSGPKAAKFQGDVEKALKKNNTLVAESKWKKTAKGLKATKVTAKNVKKVAKKLKVDAVVTGSVKRRGSRYQVSIVMRSAQSGQSVAEVDITARKAKFSARELSDVRAQLVPALDDLGGGGGSDDEVASNDDDDDNSGFKGSSDDGGELRGKDRVGDDDSGGSEDEPERTEVAAVDDEEKGGGGGGGSADADVAASGSLASTGVVGMRTAAIDVTVGLNATARNLTFVAADGLANPPQEYSSSPVAGVFVGIDAYPLAWGGKGGTSLLSNLGVTALFDRVIKLDSEVTLEDNTTATIGTTMQRFAIGLQYRHLFGQKLWIEAGARYNVLTFEIDKEAAPAGVEVRVPNTTYSYIDPAIGVRYLIGSKISAGLEVRVPLALDTGEIQEDDQYGPATVTAVEADVGADYLITSAIFARLGARLLTFGYDFDGTGALSGDDVSGARDLYYGGYLLAGYLF